MLSAFEGASPRPDKGRGERRCRYRRPLHTLAYVKLGSENGGILRDISDRGAALQAVVPLEPGQVVQMHFDLMGPNVLARRRIEVEACVAWVSPSGQAGVHFQNLAAPARRQLNEWIFAGLLASIAHLSPVLSTADPEDWENLRLAPAGLAPIALPVPPIPPRHKAASDEDLLFDWLLDRISPRTLSYAVDALVLSVAALLFLVVALAVAQTLPGWAGTLAITAGVLCFCWLLYRWMCHLLGMQTAGRWVAELAVRAWEVEHPNAEANVRFR